MTYARNQLVEPAHTLRGLRIAHARQQRGRECDPVRGHGPEELAPRRRTQGCCRQRHAFLTG